MNFFIHLSFDNLKNHYLFIKLKKMYHDLYHFGFFYLNQIDLKNQIDPIDCFKYLLHFHLLNLDRTD